MNPDNPENRIKWWMRNSDNLKKKIKNRKKIDKKFRNGIKNPEKDEIFVLRLKNKLKNA